MSELDQDGAKSLADNENTDSIETTIEETTGLFCKSINT